MNDRGISVLEQYPLKVFQTYRGRGAIICETDQGLKLLKEYQGSKPKGKFIHELLQNLKQEGNIWVDDFVENKEGEIFSIHRDDTVYVLKDWFPGRECDVKSSGDILAASKQLAYLHNSINQCKIEIPEFMKTEESEFLDECLRHQRELKRVRNFIRERNRKTEFELYFLKSFEELYQRGEEVISTLSIRKQNNELSNASVLRICHGECNQHNFWFCDNQIVITNFDRCMIDYQSVDLYHFMRKILEKYNWNYELGTAILSAYQKERKLEEEEKENLYFRFYYPEKFWKVANHYFNSRKVWVSERSIEKLRGVLLQNDAVLGFLNRMIQKM